MIADALKYLASLASDAAKPQPLPLDDPRAFHYAHAGTLHVFPRPEPPRGHKLGTLDDLLAFAEKHATAESRIFFGPGSVVLILDGDDYRIERAELPLKHSAPWLKLVELDAPASGAWFEHKPFLRLLRRDLAGTLPPGVLHDRVKRVSFENGATVTASVSRNKAESMGREITSKVSGEGEIPDEVTLEVPVYSTAGETQRFPVRCSVEVDPGRGAFCLAPLPDELDRVQALALESIRARLASCPVPAFLGSP